MSGVKERVVDITESQLETILEGIQVSQNAVIRQQQAFNQARNELEQQARRDRQALESQLQRQQSQMHAMEQEYAQRMRAQAQSFNQRIQAQDKKFDDRFDQVDDRLDNIEQDVSNLRNETYQLVQEARQYTDQRFDQLEQQIKVKEDLQKRQAESAKELYNQVINRVESHPRFQKFVDQALHQDLKDKADTAESQMKIQSFGAAYGTYRDAVYKAQTLELEIQAKEYEWIQTRQLAREAVESGLANSTSAKTHELEWELQDGALEKVATQVDKWTNGTLTQLDEQLKSFKVQLADHNSEALSTEQLKALAQDASQNNLQVRQAVKVATEQTALSQQRWEFMDAAAASLADRGYQVVNDGYVGDDNRNGYSLLLRGITGDQIAIRVDPSSTGNSLANRFAVDSYAANGKPIPTSINQDILNRLNNAFSDVAGEELPELKCQDIKYNHQGRPEMLQASKNLQAPQQTRWGDENHQQKHQQMIKQRIMKKPQQQPK